MGDFENVFGAGADASSIIDGFTRHDETFEGRHIRGRSTELLVEALPGSAIFAAQSRETFYDEGRQSAIISEGDIDEYHGNPDYDKPLDGEQLIVIRGRRGDCQVFMRVVDSRVDFLHYSPEAWERTMYPYLEFFERRGWKFGASAMHMLAYAVSKGMADHLALEEVETADPSPKPTYFQRDLDDGIE